LKPFATASDKFAPSAIVSPEMRDLINEALKALVSLGFNKNNAQAAINEIVQQRGKDLTLEELIKRALHLL
jgi:Holliday junction resolvasome RuvABC DNA-binding subunit